MLTTLCIEHFAIVKRLELDFAEGMTAFTGETGAGKSIMIDALMLALGGRADASVIRPGEDKCDITASFYFDPESEPAHWLTEHEIASEDYQLYLRRIINADGRSKSYINGQPFPLQKVKELSEKLVHIHGQHQHQTLMQHITHRMQLDRYANHDHVLQEVHATYKQWQQVKQEIDSLQNQGPQEDKIKLLTFQIDELTALHLQDGELDALHQEHQMLHHAKEYLDVGTQITHLLNGDDNPSLCSELNHALQLLDQLPREHPQVKATVELLNTALIQCEEAASEMHQFSDKVQLDPERLHDVEARMSTLHQLARKYHVDSNQLQQHLVSLEQELNSLQVSEQRLIDLNQTLQQLEKAYNKAALELRASRQTHATKLAQEITASIQKLGMPKGWVTIEITPLEKFHAHGMDRVEYKVCTNPGMEPDALSKIASGGELSRISLAIQLITAQRGSTPTLLFDEVDVGIGGGTAALVGRMLRTLGERLQVFCVTHQPQVASSAHHHFMVQKESDNQQTFTQIHHLDDQARVDEIARMLGGITITDQTKLHAKEMLAQIHAN